MMMTERTSTQSQSANPLTWVSPEEDDLDERGALEVQPVPEQGDHDDAAEEDLLPHAGVEAEDDVVEGDVGPVEHVAPGGEGRRQHPAEGAERERQAKGDVLPGFAGRVSPSRRVCSARGTAPKGCLRALGKMTNAPSAASPKFSTEAASLDMSTSSSHAKQEPQQEAGHRENHGQGDGPDQQFDGTAGRCARFSGVHSRGSSLHRSQIANHRSQIENPGSQITDCQGGEERPLPALQKDHERRDRPACPIPDAPPRGPRGACATSDRQRLRRR